MSLLRGFSFILLGFAVLEFATLMMMFPFDLDSATAEITLLRHVNEVTVELIVIIFLLAAIIFILLDIGIQLRRGGQG